MTQGKCAFLLGAGCSECAGLPLISTLTEMVTDNNTNLDNTSKEILTGIKCQFNDTENSNIEDYLSELVDLLAIADRRVQRGVPEEQECVPIGDTQYSQKQLGTATLEIKDAIVEAVSKSPDIKIHQQFVQAVHKPVRVGRADSSPVVNYLVLNYDTVLESALAMEKISYSDGIDGGATGWWNPKTFERTSLEACVLKLHGSVDWCELSNDPLPRRISPDLQVNDTNDRKSLIWPASTKYRETQLDPFVQLSKRACSVMRPESDSQLILIICGYSFGDSHVNSEIKEALTQSGKNLTVVAFSSSDEPSGCLKEWIEEPDIKDQVLIFANRGFFHGDNSIVPDSDSCLPWWKFENIVRILKGER